MLVFGPPQRLPPIGRSLPGAKRDVTAGKHCNADVQDSDACGGFAGIGYAALCIVRHLFATGASVTV